MTQFFDKNQNAIVGKVRRLKYSEFYADSEYIAITHPSVSTVETLHVVDELVKIFSDDYPEKEKLKSLISTIASARLLFVELRNVIEKYKKLGGNIDKQTNFLSQLKNLKNLIKDNARKSTQNDEEINKEIEDQIPDEKNKNKIGDLIIRGVEKKIPNFIYFDQTDFNDNKKKSEIIKKFYTYFINYVSYIRETLEDMFNDNAYRLKLNSLQSKLLKTKYVDITDYFSLITSKIISDNRGYSHEILLEKLAENEMVYKSIADNSNVYYKNFIKIFQNSKKVDQKCIESLTKLIFKLNQDSFINLNKEVFRLKLSIKLVFKPIYDKGIELYVTEFDSFKPTASKNRNELKEKFARLFTVISTETEYSHILSLLRDSVIDEKNANGTYKVLSDIYGQRIKNLSLIKTDVSDSGKSIIKKQVQNTEKSDGKGFSDDIINVKYCFNKYFFKSLKYEYLNDINGFPIFFQLLFYVHTYDHKLIYDNEDKHETDIQNLKISFSRVYNDDNNAQFKDLVEILKVMINIESFNFRLNCITSIISKLDNKEEFKVTTEVLKTFLAGKIKESEICLRLAQSFNIHLMTDIADGLLKLCTCNSNFKSANEYSKTLNRNFDIESELTSSFSIPYYLSAKLADDKKYNNKSSNYNEKNNQIVMSILFKVFNCSSDSDKKMFLENKNEINKEFVKLFESVNRLIKFYDNDNAINKDLRNKSVKYILNGFSRIHEESLTHRNESARIIIDNFINYKLEHITSIVASNSDGESKREMFDTFDTVMQRRANDTLHEWTKNTSQLGDKVYFLYCYHQYKEEKFDQWYKNLNKDSSFDKIKSERQSVKDEFKLNSDAFDLIKIKKLQHNQVGALALIYHYLKNSSENQENLFIKIGTGQAKRDHENYQKYYRYFGFKSMYCSLKSSTKDFCDNDVIYSDLETYLHLLRNEGYNTLINGVSIHLPDVSNAVLIMDEFDSLILDSDELCQYIYYFPVNVQNHNTRFDTKEDMEQLFEKKFIKKCKTKFPGIFDKWWNEQKEKDGNENRKTFQNSLGKEINYPKPFLNRLKNEKEASFVHFYLDALTFYSKFKQVFGFSGSIAEDNMPKFEKLFSGKSSVFYKIPPFFGTDKLTENRTLGNIPQVIKNRDDFLEAIGKEIRQRYQEQPILIFADSFKKENEEKSDYDYIHAKLLEAKNTFLKDCTMISIKSEEDINKNIHKIGKLGSITLATRIIARGADIKVDKNVEKGLHLLFTYYPEKENIYIQMLGRTARQDEKGSYSEIVQKEKIFVKVQEVTVNSKNKKIHDATEYFYRNFPSSSTNTTLALKWTLFSALMQTLSNSEIDKINDLEKFIKEEFL
ncbi:unnamed protein product [Didymodactylos carnosus]|uniref:Helicase C-terminal domain-containing protein n=1 Tax=Didymodactylos carnosus TaxID=1234261 RepID=A0A814RSX3_9BILA|nr:unnamed protein product [Didymodactylos carnosus]CAF3901193.1 unnamed protein product [Didymodactylos carnosus]